MKQDNILLEKTLDFSVRIVNSCRYLQQEKSEDVLSRQLLRSGTSIGANCHEAVYGASRADFIAKLQIALKETSETEYWILLLGRTGYLTQTQKNPCFPTAFPSKKFWLPPSTKANRPHPDKQEIPLRFFCLYRPGCIPVL